MKNTDPEELCEKCHEFYTPWITRCKCKGTSSYTRKYRNNKTYLDWIIELMKKKQKASLK